MSESITVMIGTKIKQLREGAQMSQSDLADKMCMARPGISNWENGKSEPSSSQLVQLARIFSVTTDEIVGNSTESKKAVILDTSALIKRPSLLEEIGTYFDEVIIPEVVIAELNNLKDRNKPSVRQKAWLVMKTINDKGAAFHIASNIRNEGKNDEKIAAIAIQRAKSKPSDDVYLLSDDIWFQFLTKKQNNLASLTPAQYVEKFKLIEVKYDSLKTLEFCSLVKNRRLQEIKNLNLTEIDVNFNNPDDGLTPLIIAVRNRDTAMINHLVTLRDIDLDRKDKHKYGFSALHHATQLKSIEIIKLLTNNGADFDLGSDGKNIGNTPLMVAAWSGFTEGVEFFLSLGTCTNQQDNNGYTPLMKASIKHDSAVIQRLISKTDLNIRSRENKTAIEYLNPDHPQSLGIASMFKEVEHDR